MLSSQELVLETTADSLHRDQPVKFKLTHLTSLLAEIFPPQIMLSKTITRWTYFVAICLSVDVYAQDSANQSSKAPPLSPEQSIATMEIQPGYSLVPVLTEPDIHEPSAIVWDGNGRMYVVEMRTYMQDIDGSDKFLPTSRVSRHEDTNGDGVYDRHTIFADNLVLPRMVLPLLDRVIIRETGTLDLKSYQDTDDDGVADNVEMWHEGGPRGGNLEHQPSGLIWNIDNWLYTTYSNHRYRFTGGKVVREPMIHGSGQWGLTHDDVGRIFYSTAGGENPVMDFQQPIIYGKLSLKDEQVPGFREVFPIDNVPDVQGGPARVRDDNTLNWFTGCCGQSIFRGDGMPADFYGDLLICEPVGRLIRRANVKYDQGQVVVSNVYDKAEFIAARDPNFRPVNSATGPDGCLYLVDMYRGIIQEGNWVRKGSYLRGVVQDYELDKNVGRGRIYRIDHETTTRGASPRMLDETPSQLIQHLSHPNGWWRSEAQKLIVLHGNQSIVPQLEKLARTSTNPLARLHAFWTLEGLGAVQTELLKMGFSDADSRVRAAAVRIAEPKLAAERELDTAIQKLVHDESPEVAIQVLLSVTRGQHPVAGQITRSILDAHAENDSIQSIAQQIQTAAAQIAAEREKMEKLARRNQELAKSVERGRTIYKTLCTTCHGADGKGQPSPHQSDIMLAPPLAGSPRVLGHKERLTRILLNGLVGPVDGKTFSDGLMLPMGANSDQWIADVANFARTSWGNEASFVEGSDVGLVRSDSASRIGPWTLNDLDFYDPPALTDRKEWKLTSSANSAGLDQAIDGNSRTRWDTGKTQRPGQWLAVELPEPVRVMSLMLDATRSKDDYPRGYVVHVSADGKSWSESVASGYGDHAKTVIELDSPNLVRHIRITMTGVSSSKYWSIHDLAIHAISADAKPPVAFAESLAEVDPQELATEARRIGDAQRGAALFYDQSLSCAKCHDVTTGMQLGPDLAAPRDGVTDAFLVKSVLDPSIEIRKAFQQVRVLTVDGIVLTGFVASEDDDVLVIREPAGGKEIRINQEEIEAVAESKISAMPPGLVNQLHSRQQFADLIKFLIDVNEGGAEQMATLKASTPAASRSKATN